MRQKTGAIGEILGRTAIRHIQRGLVVMNKSIATLDVALSGFTDAAKMIAIINGNTYSNGSSFDEVKLKELTTNTLKVTRAPFSGNSIYCEFSYQVIEFY